MLLSLDDTPGYGLVLMLEAYSHGVRLSTLGREAGIRIISLHLLRAAQTSNNKVCRPLAHLISTIMFVQHGSERY
jgi:hypothetical protein